MDASYWTDNLRHHYLRQVVQPEWAQPITTGLARRARSVLRKLSAMVRGN